MYYTGETPYQQVVALLLIQQRCRLCGVPEEHCVAFGPIKTPLQQRERYRTRMHRQKKLRSPKNKRRSTNKTRRSGPDDRKPPSHPNRQTCDQKSQETSVAPQNKADDNNFCLVSKYTVVNFKGCGRFQKHKARAKEQKS